MRGNEVIFKFLMVSYKTSLKSQFLWDPFTISFISHSLSYKCPTYLVPLERYYQGASRRGGSRARGPFSTEYIGTYRNHIMSITYNLLPGYIKDFDFPFQDFPPLAIQVPCQSSIDSGSI